MKTAILIIEDEEKIAESVKEYLSSNGFECKWANSVKEAYKIMDTQVFDCMLIDIGLPDGSGMDLIKDIKRNKLDAGIIVISAKEHVDTRVEALRVGADDFMVKPFHLSELSARISALLRRKNFAGNNVIEYEEIAVYPEENRALVAGNEVMLTRKEFELLVYFTSNHGRLITKEAISFNLWRNLSDMDVSNDIIYTHIKNLRKKLMEAGCKDYIKSIYGVGYKFGA